MATASSCRQLGGARVPGGCSRHLLNISRHLQPFLSRSHPLQHRLQRTSYDLPSNIQPVKCGAVLQQSRTSQIAGAVLLAGCWVSEFQGGAVLASHWSKTGSVQKDSWSAIHDLIALCAAYWTPTRPCSSCHQVRSSHKWARSATCSASRAPLLATPSPCSCRTT
jgi:hypothetical protein